MVKNQDYWQKRFELLRNTQEKRSEDFIKDIRKLYVRTARDIEADVTKWFNRLASNNGVSVDEAKKLLKRNELKEFKYTVEEYIKKAKENAIDGRWIKELENASARVHISRLEMIQLQLRQQLELAYGIELQSTEELIASQYTTSYYQTAYTVQKGFNTATTFAAIDPKRIDAIISKPWTADNETFKSRIVKNKNVLIRNLQDELVQSVALGVGPERIVKRIQEKLNTPKGELYKIRRIVNTESAFFALSAQKDSLKELGVEEYQVVETLDSKTDAICSQMEGKVYPLKDFKIGETAPIFHPNCRGTTAPYFADESGERFARDRDGKGIYIPGNITYQEWYDKYVK